MRKHEFGSWFLPDKNLSYQASKRLPLEWNQSECAIRAPFQPLTEAAGKLAEKTNGHAVFLRSSTTALRRDEAAHGRQRLAELAHDDIHVVEHAQMLSS
jgi:hypothetical protein